MDLYKNDTSLQETWISIFQGQNGYPNIYHSTQQIEVQEVEYLYI